MSRFMQRLHGENHEGLPQADSPGNAYSRVDNFSLRIVAAVATAMTHATRSPTTMLVASLSEADRQPMDDFLRAGDHGDQALAVARFRRHRAQSNHSTATCS